MSRYVDEHHGRFGVEPICRTLGVSVSAYYERRSGRSSVRAVEDERLLARIRQLHAANYHAYGYRLERGYDNSVASVELGTLRARSGFSAAPRKLRAGGTRRA